MIPDSTWRQSAKVIADIQQRLDFADAFGRGFLAWFGSSKVTDEFGNPIMVYHCRPIEARAGFVQLPATFMERPVWEGRLANQTVFAVFLRIERPYVLHGSLTHRLLRLDGPTIEDMKRHGYDGVILQQDSRRAFAPFDNDQVQFAMASGIVIEGTAAAEAGNALLDSAGAFLSQDPS